MKGRLEELGVFVCVIIAVVIFFGIILYGFSHKDTVGWEETEGVVIEVEEVHSNKVSLVGYVPVVIPTTEYKVKYHVEVDGVVYGGFDTVGRSHYVGQTVSVKYNPDNPTENAIK